MATVGEPAGNRRGDRAGHAHQSEDGDAGLRCVKGGAGQHQGVRVQNRLNAPKRPAWYRPRRRGLGVVSISCRSRPINCGQGMGAVGTLSVCSGRSAVVHWLNPASRACQ